MVEETVVLEGVLRDIVYRSESWCVLRVETGAESVTVVGHLSAVQPGERLRLRGRWKEHPRFGRQFEVESFVTLAPDTLDGVERYLGSGMIPGLGKVMAKRLVAHFGVDTLEVIDRHGERLSEVEGIGPKRRQRILEAWREHRGVSEVMVFLQGHGVSPAYAARIYRKYGSRSAEIVRQDPYRLALEIRGIGFRMADEIARSLGIEPDSPRRLMAGVLYYLERQGEQGHLFTPHPKCVEESAELLGVREDAVEEATLALESRHEVVIDEDDGGRIVMLPESWDAEMAAAHRLSEMVASRAIAADDVDQEVLGIERRSGIQLAAEQRRAVRRALEEHVLVITGGPGTGKTTVVRTILALLESRRARVELAAPTGRAARRLEETTGRPARTLHRLLEYSPRDGDFLRNAQLPLDVDVLILDEASMIDALLFRSVLEALPVDARLILVGDRDQLPSVGPGQVLGDIIASRAVPTVTLTEIFRQAEESSIVRNAHRVHRGEFPELTRSADEGGDFFLVERDDPDAIAQLVVEMVAERIPRRFGLDPRRDVQVLTPMRRGRLGVRALNALLQARLNPEGPWVPGRRSSEGGQLRVGDRVTQLRNNYDLNVSNGDVGWIVRTEDDGDRVVANFEGREVAYAARDLEDLSLAYATSIHKSQGSEFPAVVIPFHTEHFVMLQRNLLYTAITRGKALVVIIGSRRAVEIAIRNASGQQRRTRLADLLAGPRDELGR
ncbi:MAG: ATP-dependent RecD-like DNA helicase [Planctomycetes bacterium]|nr:ATP-dependent RecD-like DNA helicase [Planctomycetota bacterium]